MPIEELKPGIKLCLDELDHATRELLEELLVDEEEHVPDRRSACRPPEAFGFLLSFKVSRARLGRA
jgi:hypothetical protein